MDVGIIVAIVGSAVANVGVGLTLFLWLRGEANSDRRDIVNLIIAIKEDARAFGDKMAAQSREFNEKMSQIRLDAAQEAKEFHGRLCAIEEKRNK
jgi:hypothetical protein